MHLTEEDAVAAPQEHILYPLQDRATRPLKTTLKVEDQDLTMDVDTGAWPKQPAPPLHLTDVKHSGEEISVVRMLMVKVQYQGQEEELFLMLLPEMDPACWSRLAS